MQLEVDSPFARALLAGAFAGACVDLSLYPIDTLKTRLQSPKGFTASGGFRGIYAGIGSVALGAAPGGALFFITYEYVKTFFRQRRQPYAQHGDGKGPLDWRVEPLQHMAAGSAGEVVSCAIRVPTEVVKQRAQAGHFESSLAALRAILMRRRDIGLFGVWRELYRGWSITVMREVPFTIIQFPLWEAMKARRRASTGKDVAAAGESAVFGSISGAIAAAVTTPLDVLKTRMMLAREKTGLFSLLVLVLRQSGPSAFFAGIGPRVLWISSGGFVFLGSYQFAFNFLESHSQQSIHKINV